jgi:hypothetical protein
MRHRIRRRIVRLSRFAVASGERYRAGEHLLGQLDIWALADSGRYRLPQSAPSYFSGFGAPAPRKDRSVPKVSGNSIMVR